MLRVFASLFCVLLPGFPVRAVAADVLRRPNFVVIMADDNDQVSWTIGGNCCKFPCFVGVSGEF